MTRTGQINLTLGELSPAIAARGDVSATTVRVMMERYLAIVDAELRTVTLTVGEASLIVDALNGTLTDPPQTARLLWAGVDDAIRLDGLADKWSVDGPSLVEKLRGFTFAQSLAVTDAAERYWRVPDGTDFEVALHLVGLL